MNLMIQSYLYNIKEDNTNKNVKNLSVKSPEQFNG